MSIFKRLLIIFFCFSPFVLSANPFLGSSEEASLPPVQVSQGSQFSQTQFALRERMADLFQNLKDSKNPASIFALLSLAFLYGLIHAAGPGHRKTVVFSLFLSRRAKFWEPALAGFLSASVHSLAALLLMGILSLLQGAVAHIAQLADAERTLEYASFAVLALFALVLAVRASLRLAGRGKKHGFQKEGEEKEESGGKNIWILLAVSSLVPCPAASLVLIFSVYLHLIFYGIVAVLAMSLGMALVISGAAYLAWFGRERLFQKLKGKEVAIERLSALFELASYLLILVFALWATAPLWLPR